MPRYGDALELDELLRRLRKLRAQFPEEKGQGGHRRGDNDFQELEESFLGRTQTVKEMIETITNSKNSDTKSITDQIRMKRNVHNELQGIGETMRKMQNLVEKEQRRKRKNKSRVSDEELARREENLKTFGGVFKNLQTVLMKEKEAFGNLDQHVTRTAVTKEDLLGNLPPNGSDRKPTTMASMAAQSAGIGMGGGGYGGVTADQQAQLQEIDRRNQEQDMIIEEIGNLILEAGQIAETINETIHTQSKMLNDLEKDIGNTQDNLGAVNAKLKKTLDARGMSCERMCMIMMCLVVILGLVGVIVSLTST